jgi:hypothetical protein
MSTPSSVSDLIANWRTIGEFAADVGCGYEAARKMAARESVAPRHWSSVVAAAERKGVPGVTIEWLASLHAVVVDTQTIGTRGAAA